MPTRHPNHTSIWRERAVMPHYAPLVGDTEVDVVILGAGITGLTTALRLLEGGLSVAILERYRIGSGTSGSTSAHLTTLPDARLSHIEQRFGEERARLVAQAMRSAIAHIEHNSARLGIDCDFARVPGYLFTEREEDLEGIEREGEAAFRAGLPVDVVSGAPPLPYAVAGAICVAEQGRFQPLEYLAGLAEAVVELGGRIFEESPAIEANGGEPCLVRTPRGCVRATALVKATHTPTGFNALQGLMLPLRSYCLTVRVADAFPDALFWDTAEPYHYLRRVVDAQGELVLIGGADHNVGHMPQRSPYVRLEEFARQRFQVLEIAHRWSAQLYQPSDGLPFIGNTPFSNRVWVATGFSGDGLVFGTVAGMTIADELLQRQTPFAEAFDPMRLQPLATREFVEENRHMTEHLVGDRLTGEDARSVAAVAPGEGRLVQLGLRKVGVYRDEEGNLHAVRPVCAHMGCIVHFNGEEKTWDCACHGGRYDVEGRVIEGPPRRDLSPVQVVDEETNRVRVEPVEVKS